MSSLSDDDDADSVSNGMQDDNLSVDGNSILLLLLSLFTINMGRLGNSSWDEDDHNMKKQKTDIIDDDEVSDSNEEKGVNMSDDVDSDSNEEMGVNMSDDGISIIKFININYH